MEQLFKGKWYLNLIRNKKFGSNVDRIGLTLFNSKIKLTPHQIKASLFAFKSPINKGVILADEVGLGKTIEAGIVIAQLWYEKKSRILIIAPASLMSQWNSELYEKFSLDSIIMDRKTFNNYQKSGFPNPFNNKDNIIICSYQFASLMKNYISFSNFDTVIIDEAHKLRNVYNESAVIANNIKEATEKMKKILLTATPIQNSLMDIYGLTTFIDNNIFGDKNIFKLNYIKNLEQNKLDLDERLKNFIHRTLRNQVKQYIKFTKRIPKTFTFFQTSEEKELYDSVRNVLQNTDDNKYIIPNQQKHLLLLILFKLMGSSTYALTYTLESILNRLQTMKKENTILPASEIVDDEMLEDNELDFSEKTVEDDKLDIVELDREIELVRSIINKSKLLKKESKYYALLESLNFSFDYLKKLGANEKVIIFTESRKTQEFLYNNLISDGYDNVIMFNGVNNDTLSTEIYNEWINRPANIDKKDNSKLVNIRSAILDKFKNSGKILIATEAGAEGLNLQFCSLVINYDLPWNPQRVEQRIGRCHRFGQANDVVVINFINSDNKVEQRIYDLLSSKFNLFDEVFGASDEILGSIDDSKDIENSIMSIYQTCRTPEEIDNAFDLLQEKYREDIDNNLNSTKKELLENFEEDIQKYFADMMADTEKSINEIEQTFWKLTKIVLNNRAKFDDNEYVFEIYSIPEFNGVYKISSRNEDGEYIDYNVNTKLGKYVLDEISNNNAKYGKVKFDVTNYQYNLTQVSSLKGKVGYMSFNKLIIESYENEEYFFLNGIMEDGTRLDNELCEKIFRLETTDEIVDNISSTNIYDLSKDSDLMYNKIINDSQLRNNKFLTDEITKINLCAEDKIQATQLNVESMRAQRKELQKQSDLCTNMKDKERLENEIIILSNRIKKSWVELADAEGMIEEERKKMVEAIKRQNMKKTTKENIFIVEFTIL